MSHLAMAICGSSIQFVSEKSEEKVSEWQQIDDSEKLFNNSTKRHEIALVYRNFAELVHESQLNPVSISQLSEAFEREMDSFYTKLMDGGDDIEDALDKLSAQSSESNRIIAQRLKEELKVVRTQESLVRMCIDIWSLAAIFWLNGNSRFTIIKRFVAWMQRFALETGFLDTRIYEALLRGDFQQTIRLLETHTTIDEQSRNKLIDVLLSYPALMESDNPHTIETQIVKSLLFWKEKVLKMALHLRGRSEIVDNIFAIISGNSDISNKFDWLHRFCAKLLYDNQMLSPKSVMANVDLNEKRGSVEWFYGTIVSYEYDVFFSEAEIVFPLWFAPHLTYLVRLEMRQSGAIKTTHLPLWPRENEIEGLRDMVAQSWRKQDSTQHISSASIPLATLIQTWTNANPNMSDLEYIFEDYCCKLMEVSHSWQWLPRYLIRFNRRGSELTRQCLEYASVDSDTEAMQLLEICETLPDNEKLPNVLCARLAHNAYQRLQFGRVTYWCIRGNNWEQLNEYLHRLIVNFFDTPQQWLPALQDAVDHIDESSDDICRFCPFATTLSEMYKFRNDLQSYDSEMDRKSKDRRFSSPMASDEKETILQTPIMKTPRHTSRVFATKKEWNFADTPVRLTPARRPHGSILRSRRKTMQKPKKIKMSVEDVRSELEAMAEKNQMAQTLAKEKQRYKENCGEAISECIELFCTAIEKQWCTTQLFTEFLLFVLPVLNHPCASENVELRDILAISHSWFQHKLVKSNTGLTPQICKSVSNSLINLQQSVMKCSMK